MVTAIKDWSTTPGDNNQAPPDGAPEGMFPSGLNDVIRQNMAEVRAWYEAPLWLDFGLAGLTYVDADTFRQSGDVTAIFAEGRRVRATGTTPFTIYGTITASAYNAPNTDIDVDWDSGSLDATLDAVAVGSDVTNKPISSEGIEFLAESVPAEAISGLQVFTPGMGMPFFLSTAPSGWLMADGRTIGNAASGGTSRANADTVDLFTALWNDYANAQLPIQDSAGSASTRGANAAADYAANKRLPLPNLSGRSFIGRDNMSGTAANISQKSTTITTTSGSPTATVASATGLAIGMYIVSANVPAGTTIAGISGTTITMSGNASASASGTAARFSPLTDAQAIGATGGSLTHLTTIFEMAAHNHVIASGQSLSDAFYMNAAATQDGTTKIWSGDKVAYSLVGGGFDEKYKFVGDSTAADRGVTSTEGAGLAHNTMTPAFVGNWIIKL